MNHPITWGEVLTVGIVLWLGLFLLRFFFAVIVAFVQHHRDMSVNGEVEEKEPYAGKTLGL